ncbi:MAG: dephospho-CoA kinase [Bacteroidales bacterium]|nr:dephospho-CoA kinase [Bacteroidales bacterium]
MIKVAITGNIGSGKTTVSKIFNVIGIPVFYADTEARMLYFREDVRQLLRLHFGDKIFGKDSEVDTKKLAGVVFSDAAKLKTINGIIHPLVFEKYQQWLELHKSNIYTLHESAILFENKLENNYDLIITVTAPAELRTTRIMQRDGVKREKVEARMAHQLDELVKISRADFVIHNDGTQLLIPRVLEIDKQIKEK